MGSLALAASRHLVRLGRAPVTAGPLLAAKSSGSLPSGRSRVSQARAVSTEGHGERESQNADRSKEVDKTDRTDRLRRPMAPSGKASAGNDQHGIDPPGNDPPGKAPYHNFTLRPRPYKREKGLDPLDTFPRRHIGPNEHEVGQMLRALAPSAESVSDFVKQVIPPDVLSSRDVFSKDSVGGGTVAAPMFSNGGSESEVAELGEFWSSQNRTQKTQPNFFGSGYWGTLTPEVIKRNVLENPAWYTSYTPYQPEISQGRLESLLNFQTMVSDLTALPIANASLLDEATAGAEAMTLSLNSLPASRAKRPGRTMLVAKNVLRRTLEVMRARAEGSGLHIEVVDIPSQAFFARVKELGEDLVGAMVQYPDPDGRVADYREVAKAVHEQGALLSCATELMALTLLTPPGEWGADVAFGTSQRFGVPLGSGGPHAAFFAVADKYKRKMPGRLVGVSKDRLGGRALRLALQTREQHIRREKATSNVCTAQALPANVSAMYAIYHGPEGLRAIAESIMRKARYLATAAEAMGLDVVRNSPEDFIWDTVKIRVRSSREFVQRMSGAFICRHGGDPDVISFTLDEATTVDTIYEIVGHLAYFAPRGKAEWSQNSKSRAEYARKQASKMEPPTIPEPFRRTSPYLQHPVFNSHHSETEMLRYIHHLASKDLSLVHSMIPLGSCTMKLNGSVEMSMMTLPGFADTNPHSPQFCFRGYKNLFHSLRKQLQGITGMDQCWLEPNSGAQGEFAGLRAIRRYHEKRGEGHRDICLIPVSAHGTNPASAAMAGMRVVPIKCDAKTGNLDLEDLRARCEQHHDKLGAIMVTYPSTYGVFEPHIREVCEVVHAHGGQVYMDGANMNAQVGLCSPGEIGADVCHLNLHKTFCIPHGGGGPGAGPICAKEHLDLWGMAEDTAINAAKFGNASVLPISWAYNALMGAEGLKKATEVALLSANYLLARLKPHYPILYTNEHGRCAHEFILDARPFRETAGIEVIDIAKRLQDYGFHAPTMSFPVAGTLMIEPTESESLEELDRFADALVSIRAEIREVEEGRQPREGNVLKLAPHPLHDVISGDGEGGARWDRPYSREKAAFPLPWLREKKFWPSVARVDDAHGDLNLFCTCPPVEDTTGGVGASSVQTSETK